MRTSVESHRGGINEVPESMLTLVRQVISDVDILIQKGSAPAIRTKILEGLTHHGWSGEVRVSPHSDITITSAKDRVGLCLQTGNMSRMYADLLKLQKLYNDNGIIAAILVVPSLPTARVLGSNLTNSNRLCNELTIFNSVINCPIVIISMD